MAGMFGKSWPSTTVFDRMFHRAAGLPGMVAAGHYGWPVPLAAAVGLHAGPPLDLPVRLLVLVAVLGGAVAVAAHAQTVASCGLCRSRLVPPAGPRALQAELDTHRWLLRMTHRPWRSIPLWALVAAVVALDVTGGPVGRWLSAVPMTVLFVAGLIAGPRAHARLELACPWCHDDGHGGQGGRGPGGPGGDDPQPTPGPDGLVPDHVEDVIAEWDGVAAIPDPVVGPITRPITDPAPRRVGEVRVPRPRGTVGGRGIGGAS